jgi:superfamily II DNA or RNA helicase
MTGFFQSSALREMAPGLAEFITNSKGRLRLLASPYLTREDQEAIKTGVTTAPDILAKRLEELYGTDEVSNSALTKHTLECLAYLISVNRIEIKLVLVRNGLFHPKIRIFSEGNNYIAVHGSNNLTRSGFTTNMEQIVISRSWLGGDQAIIVQRLRDEFEIIWEDGTKENIRTYDLPEAIRLRIVQDYLPKRMPTSNDFKQAWNHDLESGKTQATGIEGGNADGESKKRFEIPQNLEYETGDFAHQGKALKAWESAGRIGILEMATGSGKTLTSLIAARRLFDETKHLLIVIGVPYIPLIFQWSDEVRKFGLEPTIPGNESHRANKLASIQRSVRNLKIGASNVECVVVTHDFLCDPEFQREIVRYSGAAMLIADEVHDLGTASFLENPHQVFNYRLGLSATPIRQYDDVGTQGLKDYFGEIVFSFTLKEAIGKCLVPYNYYVHVVELASDELEEWLELSQKLKSMGWKFTDNQGSDSSKIPLALQRLLNRRRRILEQASGKIASLHDNLRIKNPKEIKHTLVYASDKGRDQLTNVNRMLMDDLNLRIHQVTQEETGRNNLTQVLLSSFAKGDIQVITAMRVLDEGVDIPEVSTAFILASTTVERQWVQRRGRVLRKCSRIDKQIAYIHDFLVVPARNVDLVVFGNDILKIL